MPPVVAPLFHFCKGLIAFTASAAADDDHVLNRRGVLERLVGIPLERNHLAAAVSTVGGDEKFDL